MTVISECPVCQSTEWGNTFDVKDYSISNETFQLKQCEGCTLRVTSPRPETKDLSAYYQSENYISHSGKANNFINSLYLIAREFSLRRKTKLVNSLQQKGKVLDFGCGTGEFLNALQRNGWDIQGVEPNESAREKAEQLTSARIHKSIEDSEGPFNLITLWHVLEHLPDLDKQFELISKSLAKNGVLLIAVPNYNSWDSEKYKDGWAGYDVPRHLWHFSKKSMVLLLQKNGFKLNRSIPMKLDSYYVSMLSEKYRNKNTILNLVRGFSNGFISNWKAKKSGEYSSLIYIAGK